MENKTRTKGNVIIEDIKIGDIFYEYEYGIELCSEVISLPVCDQDGLWTWKSKKLKTGEIIEYATHKDYPHYGPNLYTYKAYFRKI